MSSALRGGLAKPAHETAPHAWSKDLYRAICDTASRPVTWLAQGTTGTRAAFQLKCALGDPAFHWDRSCNTEHKPSAYLLQEKLRQCYAKGCNDLNVIKWADQIEAALKRDLAAKVSVFDVPFNMARPYAHTKIATMTRNTTSWASSRAEGHKDTLVCKDSRHGLQLIACARACRYSQVTECFAAGQPSTLAAAYEIEQGLFKDVRSVKPTLPKVSMTIATVVNNEATYIKEWIMYHALRGVQRFVIYDNDSTDSLRSKLSPLIERGLVIFEKATTLCHMPGLVTAHRRKIGNPHDFGIQGDAMMHAINTYGPSTTYMACIDADEFLHTYNKDSVVPKNVEDHLPLEWNVLNPLRVAKGTPILSTVFPLVTYNKDVKNVVRTKVILNTHKMLEDVGKGREASLWDTIHEIGFKNHKEMEPHLDQWNSGLKIYHAWCRHSECLAERRSKDYFTSHHEHSTDRRVHAHDKPTWKTPLMRWHYKVQTQLRGNQRQLDHVMLYGIGRSGTSIAQYVLSPRRLAVFEPCSIFDKLGSYDLFDWQRSVKCRELISDLADCHITLDTFSRLKELSNQTYRSWSDYTTWMNACWQSSLIIKEIRINPSAKWRTMRRFRFIHMQRNLADVVDSRSHVNDIHFDREKITANRLRLQETAKTYGDLTIQYEQLVSAKDGFVSSLAARVQLSSKDLSQTVPVLKRSFQTRHAHQFLNKQHLKQPPLVKSSRSQKSSTSLARKNVTSRAHKLPSSG